jgi:hypothetical protein
MWSQLLAEILGCPWKNLSAIGAGNEAIAALVQDQLATTDKKDSLWIIQWTEPVRLDLRIEPGSQILDKIYNDPVYYKNFITTANKKTYWCSSASVTDIAKDYRNLIPLSQHQARSQQHILATAYALEKSQVEWYFIFTYPADWAKSTFLPEKNCIWHDQYSFRKTSQHRDLDVGEVQPISSIHLDFLEKYILPNLEFNEQQLLKIKLQIIAQDQHQKTHGTHKLWNRDLNKRV